MKKALFIILLSLPITSCAQNKFGQWAITPAVTYSFYRGLYRFPFREYENKFRFTLGYQTNVDFAFLRRISVGFGATYHRHLLDISNYQYEQGGVTITENPTQTINALGVYIRGSYHSLEVFEDTDEMVDLYAGVHYYSLMAWTENNSADPDFHTFNLSNGTLKNIPGIHAGVRFYPTPWFGISTEIAIPSNYTFTLGLAFRLGGRDKFFSK